MLGSSKRRFSRKTKLSCEAAASYQEAKRYFGPCDRMRKTMKKVMVKQERKNAQFDIDNWY